MSAPDDKVRRSPLARARAYLREDLWKIEAEALPRARRAGVSLLRLGVLVTEGLSRDRIHLRASALAYKTVFSLVPLLAVMFAVFKGFGGLAAIEADVRAFIQKNLAVGSSDSVIRAMDAGLANLHAGAVGAVGCAILMITAVLLLGTVENTLNDIWGVRQPRSIFRRFAIYWTILTLGPVLIGASTTFSAAISSSTVVAWLNAHVALAPLVAFVLPPALAWAAFTCLYLFMPNARVRVRPAVAAALLAAILWEAAKFGFIRYNAHIVPHYRIYGSLGALPVFLLWIYLSWLIILAGAEVSFAMQTLPARRREIRTPDASHESREQLAVRASLLLAARFRAGEPPLGAEDLARRLEVPIRLVNDALFALTSRGVLAEIHPGGGYIPAKDLRLISLWDIVQAVRAHGSAPPSAPDPAVLPAAEALARAGDASRAILQEQTLERLTDGKAP
jgi:membrane protein